MCRVLRWILFSVILCAKPLTAQQPPSEKSKQQILVMHNLLRVRLQKCSLGIQPPPLRMPLLMIWADSTHIGCGIANCSRFPDFPNDLTIVCNYGPAGNRVGEVPYVAADSSYCT
ncbi:hypothetical protein P879_07616 [Paragonimus westermani]|uniref:SCP domain-containing protein n=1 Tax=Paragonimus westermani TaxID=34504 RepID=A0A8T0D118_9TREM|nr:hypothetical protein P879_07616 [Paragonimus westermani]